VPLTLHCPCGHFEHRSIFMVGGEPPFMMVR
jgi:hypothetical protein